MRTPPIAKTRMRRFLFMAKVQFNCRLNERTIQAINKNAAQMGAAAGRKVSQAEVIERTFDGEMIASTRGLPEYTPKIEAKIKKNVTPRRLPSPPSHGFVN